MSLKLDLSLMARSVAIEQRNRCVEHVLDRLATRTRGDGHYARARTRVAGQHGLADASDDEVDQAIADTAPPEEDPA